MSLVAGSTCLDDMDRLVQKFACLAMNGDRRKNSRINFADFWTLSLNEFIYLSLQKPCYDKAVPIGRVLDEIMSGFLDEVNSD